MSSFCARLVVDSIVDHGPQSGAQSASRWILWTQKSVATPKSRFWSFGLFCSNASGLSRGIPAIINREHSHTSPIFSSVFYIRKGCKANQPSWTLYSLKKDTIILCSTAASFINFFSHFAALLSWPLIFFIIIFILIVITLQKVRGRHVGNISIPPLRRMIV